MYENATLKVQVHQLMQNIEKLKNHMQKSKKINVDAKIIEKLTTQSTIRYTMYERKKEILLNFHCSIDNQMSEKNRVILRLLMILAVFGEHAIVLLCFYRLLDIKQG